MLFVFLFLFFNTAVAQEPADILNEARRAQWIEDWHNAINKYEEYLRLEPLDEQALEELNKVKKTISPVLDYYFGYYTDSNDFKRQSHGVYYSFYPQASTRVKTGYYYSYFTQGALNLARNSSAVKLNHRICPKFSAGAEYIFHDWRDTAEDNGAYSLDLYSQASVYTGLYGKFSRYKIIDTADIFSSYGYNIVNDLQAATTGIGTKDGLIAITQKLNSRLSLLASMTYGDYSDDNIKRNYFAQIDYMITDKIPEVHLKYHYFMIDFARQNALYWSPNNFDGHTVLASAQQPLGRNCTLYAESALSYIMDTHKAGIMELLEIRFLLTDNWNLKVSGFYTRSSREDQGNFSAKNFILNLTYKF